MRTLRGLAATLMLVCVCAQLAAAENLSLDEKGATKWAISIDRDPIILSSRDSTYLSFYTYSPKKIITVGFLHISFLKDSAVVQSSSRIPTEGLAIKPGDGSNYLILQPTLVDAAKRAGANRLQVDLVIGGIVRSSDSTTIDYDLSCSPTAEPSTGSGTLQVKLRPNTQGGIPPYNYEWLFYGDTGSSSDEEPIHYYSEPGYYGIGVTVTDSMGGVVWGQTQVEVSCPDSDQ